ncbi:hypothetical protein SBA4_3260012 [Candidatus Sulfopaludibacter sp. SbA4]|nr:hypothetical protein SBA4_3260012 [Candidatus Sulfopaludibacter sp. SbA4]
MHFQDVPDRPRELLDSTTRLIPGDGVCALVRILRKLAEKGYFGPLSVELMYSRNARAYWSSASMPPPASNGEHIS